MTDDVSIPLLVGKSKHLKRINRAKHLYPTAKAGGFYGLVHKMAYSAKLFGYADSFESLKKYALILMGRGVVFSYGRHDLSWVFKD